MASIRDLILELLYGVSRRALNGPFEGNDTFSLEKELLEASAGPLLSKMGLNLKNRGDIDTLAHLLMGHFGL